MRSFKPGNPNAAKMARSHLTEADVREIRRMGDSKTHTVQELGYKYAVTDESIRKILRRNSWQWVPEEVNEAELKERIRADLELLKRAQGNAGVKFNEAGESVAQAPKATTSFGVGEGVARHAEGLLNKKMKPKDVGGMERCDYDDSVRKEDLNPGNLFAEGEE